MPLKDLVLGTREDKVIIEEVRALGDRARDERARLQQAAHPPLSEEAKERLAHATTFARDPTGKVIRNASGLRTEAARRWGRLP